MCRSRLFSSLTATANLLLASLLTGCATTTPTINLESQRTDDGLYEVIGIDADEALARPGANMPQYSKIFLQSIEVEFRSGGEAAWSQFARRSSGPYEVTEELAEEYRAIAVQEITEEFGESAHFTLAEQPGAGVLSVKVRLADVTSYIPPEQSGRNSMYLNELGEALLVMELRDSITQDVIARTTDRHTAENIGDQIRTNIAITNTAEVERLFRLLSRQLRRQLEQFGSLNAQ